MNTSAKVFLDFVKIKILYNKLIGYYEYALELSLFVVEQELLADGSNNIKYLEASIELAEIQALNGNIDKSLEAFYNSFHLAEQILGEVKNPYLDDINKRMKDLNLAFD